MHKEKVKTIISSSNRINLYRGCEHNCIYCDSRSKCYQMDHEFTDILVKENAIELLKDELTKKRNKMVFSTGSMSDPYTPLEKDLEYTKKMLEVIYQYGHGIHIQTKSNLVLRDLELLKKINRQTKASVAMTITTADEALCKIIEPNAPTTKERLETLKELSSAGIDTYLWICPILPFINDGLDNLRTILQYAKEANVKGIVHFDLTLTLREGNREYFYEMLDQYFPKMKDKYIKTFQKSYLCPSPYQKYLLDYLINFCKKNQIEYDYSKITDAIYRLDENPAYEQLSLF